MLHKIEILGAALLILLGFILAIGYPNGGVKNEGNAISNKIVTIPTLTKEGNAKNFRVNTANHKKILPKIVQHNTTSQKVVTTKETVHNLESKVIKTVKHKVKKIIKPPVKKKIKLAPPPPPKEEEDDEGC